MATSINPSLQHFTLDGVVGLGLGKASSFGEESYFESVIAYGRVVPAEILVGLHLTPSGGELIVGGRDSSKYTGDLVYIDIDPDAVSRLRDIRDHIPCLRLTRTQYRNSGRCS